MSETEIKAINDKIFAAISGGDLPAARAVLADYTRLQMYRLYHVPVRYLLPAAEELGLPPGDNSTAAVRGRQRRRDRDKLGAELTTRGYIALDRYGEPCVLSGRTPVIPHPVPEDMPVKKTVSYTPAEVHGLVAKGMAADGKIASVIEIAPDGGATAAYELAPAAPGTAAVADLTSLMVEKAAGMMEQCQVAGVDYEHDVRPRAEALFLERAKKAGRLDVAPEVAAV